MANSMAEVCTQSSSLLITSTVTSFFKNISAPINQAKKCRLTTAKSNNREVLLFKYRSNSPRHQIDQIRQLLRLERDGQQQRLVSSADHDGEEFDFFGPDFERMMQDDWLVTRFLLRGMKKFQLDNNVAGQMDNQLDETSKQRIYDKTMELIRQCAKFRYEFKVNNHTREDEFPLEWTSVDGLFNYRPDLVGNPTVYLRVALHRPKLIETEELRFQFKRLLLYNLEKCDQDLYNKPGKAICCIFDLTNAAFENIDLELTSWMIRSFKSCGPKLVNYVIVYNAPWFFTTTFKLICSTLLSSSKRQSIKFVYGNEILDYIEYDNLPAYIKSTIY